MAGKSIAFGGSLPPNHHLLSKLLDFQNNQKDQAKQELTHNILLSKVK